MPRLQGIGTDYYGKKDFDKSNNSYITTKWFVLFLLPIKPLGSFRLRKVKQESKNYVVAYSNTTSYEILSGVPLQKGQVFRTYLFAYGFLGLIVLSLVLSTYQPEFMLAFLGLFAILLIWAVVKN